ncbi:hypothetical protein POM88_018647 [Heracleum sosnowskyi]|uniref:MSP domain-containing protein n=1 Tax=Heracleum sosnowskyi TaxID=360622 RepID=A0AAD8MZ58_9APIA|nr:hypothetical protein POM88_018647 [Heracleum sosnowskyi]
MLIHPYIVELEKQSTCAIKLTNVSDRNLVAFKVNTTLPVNCCVYPNIGLIKPNSTCNLTVIIQAQSSCIDYMRCNDKFLIQTKIVPFRTNQDDVTPDMFADDSVSFIEENTLWVVPVPPLTQAHSPVSNLTIHKDLLWAKLDSLEAEFNTSKPKEVGCTTTRVNVKPIVNQFLRALGILFMS